jgi:general secretion pathway protein L
MSGTIYIQEISEDAFQWTVKDGLNPPTSIQLGDIEALSLATKGCQAVLILPGHQTLFTQVSIPSRNRQRILQALPYALEDQFIEDIEQLHFAIPATLKPSEAIPVCAVSREKLSGLLETLRNAGIDVQQVCSGIQCLPFSEGQWTALLENDLVSIRTSASSGFTFDSNNLFEAFNIALNDEHSEQPEKITILDARSGEEPELLQLPEKLEELPVEIKPSSKDILEIYASNHNPQQAINLLQGRFALKKKRQFISRRWLPAAVVLIALTGIQLTSFIIEYTGLRKQTAAQQKQIEKLFKQALPDARRMTGFKSRMQQRLKQLQDQSAGSGTGFLELMASSGSIFRQYSSLKLTGVQYRQGMIDIELTIRDLQTLEAVKQNLSRSGLKVEIRNANVSGNVVTGRLQVKGAS